MELIFTSQIKAVSEHDSAAKKCIIYSPRKGLYRGLIKMFCPGVIVILLIH